MRGYFFTQFVNLAREFSRFLYMLMSDYYIEKLFSYYNDFIYKK
jgi:hypothetical protein